MLQTVASQSSPLVFNNSCWSWSGIADSFLVAGAIGYIGTLWAVDNKIATDVAKEFYGNVFQTTISEAIHNAAQLANGSDCDHIYNILGITFFNAPKGVDIVLKNCFRSTSHWESIAKTATPKSSAEI